MLARLVEAADRLQRDAVEVERFGAVRRLLESLVQDLDRLVVTVGLVEDLAKNDERVRVFRLLLKRKTSSLFGRLECRSAQLNLRSQDKRGNAGRSELEHFAENPKRLDIILLSRKQGREVVVRLNIFG